MKKRARSLIILGAALVVCIGAYIGVTLYNSAQEKQAAEAAKPTQIYADGRSAPVSISYESGGTALSFTLEDGMWYVAGNKDFPLNQASLTGLASALNGLTAVRTLDAASPLSSYGLDKAAYTVSATDGSGNSLTLLIGAKYQDYYYAMAEGGDKVYTISSSIVNYLKTDLMSLIVLDTLPALTELNIDVIGLESGASSLTLDKHQNKDGTVTWFIVDGTTYTAAEEVVLPEGAERLPEKYVDNAVKAMSSLRFSSCADFKPTGEALTAYGLDARLVTLTVDYTKTTGTGLDKTTESGTVTLEIGGALEDGTGYYARLPGSEKINVLPGDAVTPLIEALGMMGSAK
jgi:hypothetical protein